MRNLLLFLFCLNFLSLSAQSRNAPTEFIENKGQITDQNGKVNPAVKYLLNTCGMNVQLRQQGFSYDVYNAEIHDINHKEKNTEQNSWIDVPQVHRHYTSKYTCQRIDIDFVNSNNAVQIVTDGKSADFENYYNVGGGISDVHHFKKVTYLNIYDNIDAVFFVTQDSTKPVEYNFVIHPGGKITDIQLKFNGAKTSLSDGKIKMDIRHFGQMEETLPLSWTGDGQNKKVIGIRYRPLSKNVYGFESEERVSEKNIVIDPVPIRLWSTYYGGSGGEFPSTLLINSANNVIVAGSTGSGDNIATAGPNTSGYFSGGNFIAKYQPDGQRIWSSYYPFYVDDLQLDNLDNMYVVGKTLNNIPNVPSPGCFQPVKDQYTSDYLIKLDSAGAKMWGTWYGGNENEDIYGLTIDSSGNIYIVGGTSSSDAMASPGAFLTTKPSPGTFESAFVAKFDSTGNRIWGTYYGGDQPDGFFDCSIGSDGNLNVVGTHNSSNGIATPGTYQSVSSTTGGMIVKFDPNGNRIWGTFIADNTYTFRGRPKGDEIVLSGRAFGNSTLGTPGTMSENMINPLPSGSTLTGIENNYILKFNIQTQQYIWGTYFPEQIIGLDIDSYNNIFFSGYTNISSGITTTDAFMAVKNNYYKSYLIKLNPLGQKAWGTYYGGNYAEEMGTVKVDHNNDIYLYGMTNGSTTGIATPGASQMTLGSNPDTYLVKFRDCMSSTLVSSNGPVCIGGTLNLTASGGTNYSWTGPNGFTSNLQNPAILNVDASHSGQYFCNITGGGSCDGVNSITVVVGDNAKPVPDVNPLPTITGDCNTILSAPTATDQCAGAVTATTTDPINYSLPGTYTVHWKYNDGNGNTETQNQIVSITSVTLPTATSPQMFCVQQNASLSALTATGQNIKWYDSATGGNLLTNNTIITDGTVYYASQTINGCESLRMPVVADIKTTAAPIGSFNQTLCATQIPTLNTLTVSGNNIIWYDSVSGTNTLPDTTTLVDGATYYATQTLDGCESITRLAITVTLINTLNANDYADTVCDELNDGSEATNLLNYESNLIANSTNFTFDYYDSQSGAENQTPSDLITSAGNYPLMSGSNIIYVRVTSDNGCHQIVKLNLSLVREPVIGIPDTIPLCENTNVSINAGQGFDNYLWSNGSTTQFITVSEPGNYAVTVGNVYGNVTCSTTKSFTIILSNPATITSIDIRDWTDSDNTITVNTSGLGDYEYSIDGTQYQSSNVFMGLPSGAYTVYIKDKNQCGIVTGEVFLFMYPKFFTPNGDGYSDIWTIKFSSEEAGLSFNIFDRYGKLLADHVTSWDGKFNGHDLPSDDYWFLVTRASGKEYRGHFTLKR